MSTPIQILNNAAEAVAWLRSRVQGDLQTDSRKVKAGDAFVAWPGAATDGRAYVGKALEQGAAAVLVEADGLQAFDLSGDSIAALKGLKAATGLIADQWFAHPSGELDVLAVTGTNGKTTTAWWLAHALSKVTLNTRTGCALVGTLGVGVPPALESTGMTTPDPVLLQRAFRSYADQGLAACAIEASSIGIVEHRLDGSKIRVALFTNFTQDHLDYHGSMDAYWQAKAQLFDWPGLPAAVVNIDDAHGARLWARLQGRAMDVWSVSIEGPARLQAKDIGLGDEGLSFTVLEAGHSLRMNTRLVGQYNVSNLLGVLATLRCLGLTLEQAVQACADLEPVPGRMQQIVKPGQPLVAVDYAHTPDALEKALRALQPAARQRQGKLWCVFGCGGDRDNSKRPLMRQAAQAHADGVFVTSDNPRSEVPESIIDQILAGMQAGEALHVQADRAAAIAQAIARADARDVVLIAGKGHEDYQETKGVRHPFSDMAEAQKALAAREGKIRS
ncbi:UDP-N-acetylmuramoyl-L-alanyl-D-glutamate--2,6-diaminopimelate ligase [Comamonas thiooxydans]|uniref:UDP-N-acetylmuramoyl-L-alanyl-D-glutamate--2,6-diaminopimelate ligase n=1 Tax=Comamonas thiooxydans TaxID=363952 RepID=A0A0E3BT79_9BURK|nr:UDP-N-acetylmuramoyl-L-alanyl-D-glutamate--2,6-diaminopimelate ligase [Comamonas thiooxydans]KGH11403.1 UDP-N-acetylmuramoylalanyl-D-glutamate--2,6-diaminopimelate ligase [Comamonas thiooxydans]KGH17587.1 UDP-N-acetylmuramoylalanyl-D-glutamate--2,6-diaminopimelate ligase [Comamonas thiooxydans]KGH24414.1 UDP-N-acetylmuramoylalanyl-D-glutamate--2,6-diaminopimelate ligase [Comamonas thiooxydans]